MRETELHVRTIEIAARPGDDGLLHVRAELWDDRRIPFPSDLRLAGRTGIVHRMGLAVSVDPGLAIRDVAARMDVVPFEPSEFTRGEGCRQILPNTLRLVGLSLDGRYAEEVFERFGGPNGCFHLSSLAQYLPAAVRAAARRLCVGALRPPAGCREQILESCAAWGRESPLWTEAREVEGSGFREFRRRIVVRAGTSGGAELRLSGSLEDEPADGDSPVQRAELRLDLQLPSFAIESAEARLDPPPFGACLGAAGKAKDLVGLSLLKGFTAAALDRLCGPRGCGQLGSLVVAIAAVTPQAAGALAGLRGVPLRAALGAGQGAPVDSCHMWRAGGPLVARMREPSS